MSEDEDDLTFEYAERPNKTQIKREIGQIFGLAEQLAELSPEHWRTLALPEPIIEALTLAARLPATGARKRQLKFITGLLRNLDTQSVADELLNLSQQSTQDSYWHHQTEHWRDRLLSEGDSALQQLMSQCPEIDSQRIRVWLRQAKQEQTRQQPPKAARQLYRYLKPLLSSHPEH